MNCNKCQQPGEVVDTGSASGRKTYWCPRCRVRWREKAPEKNPAAVALGALGGKARAEALTAEERSASASIAASAKWAKEKTDPAPNGSRGMYGGKPFGNR